MVTTSTVQGSASFRLACRKVITDLKEQGFWSRRLDTVLVRQKLFGFAYGLQYYQGCGDIVIPKLSVFKWISSLRGEVISLGDILRHEFGHALVDNHPDIVHSSKFESAFGSEYASTEYFSYDKEKHVSTYAAHNMGEDFAETFVYYVKYKGELPDVFNTSIIKKKWEFIGGIPFLMEKKDEFKYSS